MRPALLLQTLINSTIHAAFLWSCIASHGEVGAPSAMAPSPGKTEHPCLQTEHQALLEFKQQVTHYNKSWIWDASISCCQWQGVTCSSPASAPQRFPASPAPSPIIPSSPVFFPRVISLSLPQLNITGPIPSSLFLLTSLHTLDLSSNHFSGPLPSQFASLTRLRSLDLSFNHLSGSLSILSAIPSLQSITISSNNFTGELPAFSNFKNLQEINVSHNHLTGQIDTGICAHAPMVRVLDYSVNKLNGWLRYGLGACTQLQELSLALNMITGPIPQDIYSITSLVTLSLAYNSFNGTLDAAIGNLTNLKHLLLPQNNLSGPLPKTLSQNSKLVLLSLPANFFTGSLDVNFSNLTLLEELYLDLNFFSGVIPEVLSLCASLRILNLALNNFTGSVPSQFNSLKNLTFVSLSTNNLNGSLGSFQGCTNLVSLILTKNFFTEPLPSALDGFENLQVLALGFLGLRGSIPGWLQRCRKLQVLDMSWNHLKGELPIWLGDLPHLFYLELSNNSIRGTIPPQLFMLPALTKKDTNTKGLVIDIMGLFDVQRQMGLPDLTYKKPVALPPSILLCHNALTGPIPPDIHRLKMLLALDLSRNSLAGRIPASLANMTSLESLDLSYNGLTGPIPESLSSLTFLSTFNVAFNNLSGPVPQGTQFGTFPPSSYVGNPGLCGAPLSITCTNKTYTALPPAKSTKNLAAVVSVSVVAGIIGILLATALWMLSGRSAVHHGTGSSIETDDQVSLSDAQQASVQFLYSHQKLTMADIFKATNNFGSTHIVGCGGFGLVYRADLEDGTKLAIKKLTGDCGQMEREFRAEVEALSKAQHKNLVPLRGFLQIGHAKLLVYSYMENGSLDYWLHERTDGAACLDWQMRLKVAQGAAAGLAYLHQVCNPHIVHRDIKSSNILLDENFDAHLADFGLARLMMSTQTHVTTELVGTLGYIPPEYGEKSNATPRGDVYSFGVVLLELLTGKRPVDVCRSKGTSDLVAWVRSFMHESSLYEIFDDLLLIRDHETQMQQVLNIACWCINRDPSKRPSIKDVVSLLDEV